MSAWEQISAADLSGVELQPILHFVLSPVEIERRLGVRFETVSDDFDALTVAAVVVGDGRYLLLRYVSNPRPGTEVHSPVPVEPVLRAQALVEALGVSDVVSRWWDGTRWRDDGLPPVAA